MNNSENPLQLICTSILSESQKLDLFQLWNREFPKSIAYEALSDLEAYLAKLEDPVYYLLVNETGQVLAWLAKFMRNRGKWFSLIIHSGLQGQGYGSRLLLEARKGEKELFGWAVDHDLERKNDGTLYRSPLPFYYKNGFQQLPDERFESEVLSSVKIHWKI